MEIGEQNVVQVVTDNGSNYVLAGKFLQAKRCHLFWTLCAAHCLDLMLEDIGKLDRVKRTIKRGISLVGFIYNHSLALNTMRQFTSKTELVRHGVTTFATTFLTLQRLYKQKNNLRRMFTSDKWSISKTVKDPKGKRTTDIVLSTSFWNDVVFCLKAMRPIVGVLRMGQISNSKAFRGIGKEDKYKDILAIIDKRWDCQLHHPLHAAGHYLNPQFFYSNPRLDDDLEVVNGYLKCFERLTANTYEMDQVMNELELYKKAQGLFGMDSAKRQRDKVSIPLPDVRAIGIHSKRRSRHENQKLEDLVYIKYNQTFKYRFDNRDLIDPILLNDVTNADEPLIYTRQQTKSIALPSSSKGKEIKETEGLENVPEQLYNIDTSDSEAEADFGDGGIQDSN
ncbi:uncharacterized protein LOC133314992 [Gastrolobium bilobum]|uniref:uncharacterized protein LOC133314992 n=1 Tax=Gastrolobium bilobum TaxID=150636 RepID=UPI002AB2E7CC|nr:uncharacterized protein LOC133314992 [Gastrolobium bilobum]